MGAEARPPILASTLPTSALPNVCVAVTFDPFGLCGPLQIWLRRLTGLSSAVLWTPYGDVLASLRTPGSAWNENGQRGINVLIARAVDLARETASADPAAVLADAVCQSSALRRGGVTIVILPPDGATAPVAASAVEMASTGQDGIDERLSRSLSGCPGVVVVDEVAVGAAFSCLGGRKHVLNDFMGRVAHAPYTAAAASALGALLARELARALAPRRKVICPCRRYD